MRRVEELIGMRLTLWKLARLRDPGFGISETT